MFNHSLIKDLGLEAKSLKPEYRGRWPHRYLTFNLDLKPNKRLKDKLRSLGFFKFHTSNNGRLVSLHQIVAFLHCGGQHALKRGLTCQAGETEVHHLDGDTLNNNPENLVYLPTQVHQAITISQRRTNKFLRVFGISSIKDFHLKLAGLQIWNRQGRLVSNLVAFVAHALERTLLASAFVKGLKVRINRLLKWRKLIRQTLEAGLQPQRLTTDWIVL